MQTKINTNNKRLRTADAAAYCGLSKSTFDKYRLTGEGPIFIKLGRSVVYDTGDLDSWMEDSKQTSTSQTEVSNDYPNK